MPNASLCGEGFLRSLLGLQLFGRLELARSGITRQGSPTMASHPSPASESDRASLPSAIGRFRCSALSLREGGSFIRAASLRWL